MEILKRKNIKIDGLDEKLINEICERHIQGKSMRELSRIYKLSFTVIQKLIKSKDYKDNIKINYPEKDNNIIIAICNKTNKVFEDYKNISGALTTHIKNNYNIELPSKYKRKSVEYETGKFWYDEYFKFDYREITPTKKCDYCDWETEDINNLSGAYEKHLKNIHNISLQEHLKNNPNDKEYIKREIYDKLVECKICGEEFKSITNTHLKKHNTTQFEYKMKYGDSGFISEETREKLITNYNLYLKNVPYTKTSSLEEIIIDGIPVNFKQSDRDILDGKVSSFTRLFMITCINSFQR